MSLFSFHVYACWYLFDQVLFIQFVHKRSILFRIQFLNLAIFCDVPYSDVISGNSLRANVYTIKQSVNRSLAQDILKQCFQSQERKMWLLYTKWYQIEPIYIGVYNIEK